MAVLYILNSLHMDVEGFHIRVDSDNTTALYYITNMGGMKSEKCNNIIGENWGWCRQNKVCLLVMFVTSVDNVKAEGEN